MSEHRHNDDETPRLRCFHCPVCGAEAALSTLNLTPWFCSNDDCDVLAWDPYSSLEENLTDARPISVTEIPRDLNAHD
jgi:hypothetical protein